MSVAMDIHGIPMDIQKLSTAIHWKATDISVEKSIGLWIFIDIHSYGSFGQGFTKKGINPLLVTRD